MGAKRKVTKAMYVRVKHECSNPKDDKKVMKKYKLGQTTVRAIRNSINYEHFIDKTIKSRRKEPNTFEYERTRMTLLDKIEILIVYILMLAIFVGVVLLLVALVRWIFNF